MKCIFSHATLCCQHVVNNNTYKYILVPIRRDGNISHLFISLATQRSMGEWFISDKWLIFDKLLIFNFTLNRTNMFGKGWTLVNDLFV